MTTIDNPQAKALRRAEAVLVGGTMSGFRMPDEMAFIAVRGKGTRVWDMAGREYVDFVLGSGPMILGHCHPAVLKAVQEQVECGSQFYTLAESSLQLAEEIVAAVPCAEKLRYTSTGSEATFYALRLARAFTGRDKILKFEGSYHGHNDYAMISSTPPASGGFPIGVRDSAGIPASVVSEVLVAPYNDVETTAAILDKHGKEVAAVIVEPFQRMLSPKPGFLAALRQMTREHGIVLIFDEVVTGFRLAYGGAQDAYGVTPDLTALGKIIGGGYPVAAIVGRQDIMGLCDTRRKGSPDYAYISGTLSGQPVGTAAGLATLRELKKPGTYERLGAAGERMRSGLRAVLAERKIPGQLLGEGPLSRLLFGDRLVQSYGDFLATNHRLGARVSNELLRRGYYVNAGANQYISTLHTNEEIDGFVAAVAEILKEMD